MKSRELQQSLLWSNLIMVTFLQLGADICANRWRHRCKTFAWKKLPNHSNTSRIQINHSLFFQYGSIRGQQSCKVKLYHEDKSLLHFSHDPAKPFQPFPNTSLKLTFFLLYLNFHITHGFCYQHSHDI